MRPGVVLLFLSLYILDALAVLHRRQTPAHGLSRLHELSLPLFDHLSWLLADELHSSAYATGSAKPVVAQ